MMVIAGIRCPVFPQRSQKVDEFMLGAFIEQPAPRTFSAKPDSLLIEQATNTSERKPKVTQRFTITGMDNVHSVGGLPDNRAGPFACPGFNDRRKACESLFPQLSPLRNWDFNKLCPRIVDLINFDRTSETLSQQCKSVQHWIDG